MVKLLSKSGLVVWLALALRPFLVNGSDVDVTECNVDGSLPHASISSVIGDRLRGRRKTAVKSTKAPTTKSTKAPNTTKSTKSTKSSKAACSYDAADVDAVIEILDEISDTCLMLTDGTPQNLAYQFVSSDPFLTLGSSTVAEWLHRYAMAVFYYSTDGNTYMDATWVDHSTDECDWSYVQDCNGGSVSRLYLCK
eukprot:Nitzschia sp. Nitz4//scaffold179_size51476//50177//50761//NITZ4_006936-RA/size51476-processed-gene-0.20-mRNA-1//-1//CDS//3329539246//1063//frame0